MKTPSTILWVDCLGGLLVGMGVLAISRQLSELEGLPLRVVVAMGIANVAYGCYSLYVTVWNRSLRLVQLLALANMTWLFICITIVSVWWNQISVLGLLHVLGEGSYVAALGYTEWRLTTLLTDE